MLLYKNYVTKKKRATFSGPKTLLSTKPVSWVNDIWYNGDCQGKDIERKDYNEKHKIKEETSYEMSSLN